MIEQHDVATILVNWNSSVDVARTVSAMRAEYPDLTTIVVDNGSASQDWAQLEVLSNERVLLDRREENGGYAAGVNRGLELARDHGLAWAWLMNPDALPYPGCLTAMLSVADGCGVLSPRQLSSSVPLSEDAVQYVSAARAHGRRMEHETCAGCSVGHHEVDVVTGTGLLVNVADAHEAGLMNVDFFHYKEEFEFAERVAGISPLRYVCSAQLWHERGGSLAQASPQAEYYRVRNELLYPSLRLARPWRVRARVWRWVARSMVDAVTARPETRRAIVRGVADGLRGRTGRSSL